MLFWKEKLVAKDASFTGAVNETPVQHFTFLWRIVFSCFHFSKTTDVGRIDAFCENFAKSEKSTFPRISEATRVFR